MMNFGFFFEDNYSNYNQNEDNEWVRLQNRKLQDVIPNNETAMIVYNSQPDFQKNVNMDERIKSYQQMYKSATL